MPLHVFDLVFQFIAPLPHYAALARVCRAFSRSIQSLWNKTHTLTLKIEDHRDVRRIWKVFKRCPNLQHLRLQFSSFFVMPTVPTNVPHPQHLQTVTLVNLPIYNDIRVYRFFPYRFYFRQRANVWWPGLDKVFVQNVQLHVVACVLHQEELVEAVLNSFGTRLDRVVVHDSTMGADTSRLKDRFSFEECRTSDLNGVYGNAYSMIDDNEADDNSDPTTIRLQPRMLNTARYLIKNEGFTWDSPVATFFLFTSELTPTTLLDFAFHWKDVRLLKLLQRTSSSSQEAPPVETLIEPLKMRSMPLLTEMTSWISRSPQAQQSNFFDQVIPDVDPASLLARDCSADGSYTPLGYAAKIGCLDTVKHLIEVCGASPDFPNPDSGRTPFHIACIHHKLEIAQYLVSECHVSTKLLDKQNRNCLMHAMLSSSSSPEAIKLLHWLFEDIGGFDLYHTDSQGWSILDYACGSLPMIEYVLDKVPPERLLLRPQSQGILVDGDTSTAPMAHECEPNKCDSSGGATSQKIPVSSIFDSISTRCQIFTESNFHISNLVGIIASKMGWGTFLNDPIPNSGGYTAFALCVCSLGIPNQLFKALKQFHAPTSKGGEEEAAHSSSNPTIGTSKDLFSGTESDESDELDTGKENTVSDAQQAASYWSGKLKEFLKSPGGKIDFGWRSDSNQTLLHAYLIKTNSFGRNVQAIVRWFVENGVDVNAQDDLGNTAFHQIFIRLQQHPRSITDAEVVSALFEMKADITIKNKAGMTPYHCAAFSQRGFVLTCFEKEWKLAANIPDNEGFTPLLRAHQQGISMGLYNRIARFRHRRQDDEEEPDLSPFEPIEGLSGNTTFFHYIHLLSAHESCRYESNEAATIITKLKVILEDLKSSELSMNQLCDTTQKRERPTVLHEAIKRQFPVKLTALLVNKFGAQLVNSQTKISKQTPVHFAVQTGNPQMLELLLNPYDLNHRPLKLDVELIADKDGNTPFTLLHSHWDEDSSQDSKKKGKKSSASSKAEIQRRKQEVLRLKMECMLVEKFGLAGVGIDEATLLQLLVRAMLFTCDFVRERSDDEVEDPHDINVAAEARSVVTAILEFIVKDCSTIATTVSKKRKRSDHKAPHYWDHILNDVHTVRESSMSLLEVASFHAWSSVVEFIAMFPSRFLGSSTAHQRHYMSQLVGTQDDTLLHRLCSDWGSETMNRRQRRQNATKMASILLRQSQDDGDAFMDVQNSLGKTPLHIAIEHDNLALVIQLLNADADILIKDNTDRTARQVAKQCGFAQIEAELLSREKAIAKKPAKKEASTSNDSQPKKRKRV